MTKRITEGEQNDKGEQSKKTARKEQEESINTSFLHGSLSFASCEQCLRTTLKVTTLAVFLLTTFQETIIGVMS